MTPSSRRTFYGLQFTFETLRPEDKGRQAELDLCNGPPWTSIATSTPSSSTSYCLSDALRTALKRDPIDAAHDAEQPAFLLTQRAQEQTVNALAWIAVQQAATGG